MTDVPADPDESLAAAVRSGSIERISHVLNIGTSVNARDDDQRTALQIAAEGGVDAARVLLDRGADVHATTTRIGTALHVAAARSNYAVVDLLMAHGANPDALDDEGCTPLDLVVAAAADEQRASSDHIADEATRATIWLLGSQPHIGPRALLWLRCTIALEVAIRVAVLAALIVVVASLRSAGLFAVIVLPPLLIYVIWHIATLFIELPLLWRRWPSRRSARWSLVLVALTGSLRLIWAIWASIDQNQSYRPVFVAITVATITVLTSTLVTVVMLRRPNEASGRFAPLR